MFEFIIGLLALLTAALQLLKAAFELRRARMEDGRNAKGKRSRRASAKK